MKQLPTALQGPEVTENEEIPDFLTGMRVGCCAAGCAVGAVIEIGNDDTKHEVEPVVLTFPAAQPLQLMPPAALAYVLMGHGKHDAWPAEPPNRPTGQLVQDSAVLLPVVVE